MKRLSGQRLLAVALLAAAVAFFLVEAWPQRVPLDDSFISFRYARNLLEGHGLVYNPGEPVEGYTNFLWTLVMTIPFWLDLDPIIFSQHLGLALFHFHGLDEGPPVTGVPELLLDISHLALKDG